MIRISLLLLFVVSAIGVNDTFGQRLDKKEPLVIAEQGSFAVGGTVINNSGTYDPVKRTPEGQTYHGDHAYLFYQIPVNARKLPLVFWHGIGQFSKTWETTPDGREGFQNRSEEHTSELQSLMRISYPVFCLKKKNQTSETHHTRHAHNT